MENTVTETTTNSTKGQDSYARPKAIRGYRGSGRDRSRGRLFAPKLSHGSSVSAAPPTPTVQCQPAITAGSTRTDSIPRPVLASGPGRVASAGRWDAHLHRIQGWRCGAKGALLFIIDPTPYQIKFDEGTAQVAKARARLELATTELARAQTLQKTDAGTVENVDQRSAEQRSAQAALDEAEALVRDAKFDLDRTRVYAPFYGRMGTHLVSVGNLVSGNRGGGSSHDTPGNRSLDRSHLSELRHERGRLSQF